MALLNEQFRTFISNINPDEQAVAYAVEAHTRVRECLGKEDDFKEFVEGSFLYGSYKRQTAVGDIKDVDVVILTNFDTSSDENTPAKVLRKLKAALARCYDDPDNPEYQRRSIRVNDPLPDNPEAYLTLDIIPAVAHGSEDDPLLVPDKEQKVWILSHPRAHLKHTTHLNSDERGKGRFVPLVKIMKWWWKYQCEILQPDIERPKPKGFWVEVLTGENFDEEQTTWANHFISVLENIKSKYSDSDKVPELTDVGLPNKKIKTNMNEEEFALFMEAVSESLDRAILARDELDNLLSSEIWREIFGDAFPLYDEEENEETRVTAKSLVPSNSIHAHPLQYPLQLNKKSKVQLNAYIYKGSKRMGGLNSGGRLLSGGYSLKFVARTRTRGDYDVLWQVVNTGRHAARRNALRGEFFRAKSYAGGSSSNQHINWETTEYHGSHWIECFIIQNGVCVGKSGRFHVKVNNPNWDAEDT